MQRRKEQLLAIRGILKGSEVVLSLFLKLRMAEICLKLQQRYQRKFGLFVILGWKDKWNESILTPDIEQDIFAGRNINIEKPSEERVGAREESEHGIVNTINFDGAILIDNKGLILHSGTMIGNLRPKEVVQKVNPGTFADISSQFGFKKKVHMRHIAAITASYVFKGTTVFTISEETGDFHIFEKGKIVYSTVPREDDVQEAPTEQKIGMFMV